MVVHFLLLKCSKVLQHCWSEVTFETKKFDRGVSCLPRVDNFELTQEQMASSPERGRGGGGYQTRLRRVSFSAVHGNKTKQRLAPFSFIRLLWRKRRRPDFFEKIDF